MLCHVAISAITSCQDLLEIFEMGYLVDPRKHCRLCVLTLT